MGFCCLKNVICKECYMTNHWLQLFIHLECDDCEKFYCNNIIYVIDSEIRATKKMNFK